jgi:Spy/CpxP family protein refolding chaperone
MNANLTPEESAQLFDLKQQFMNDTAGLRKQMMVKRTELAELWQSATPDQSRIQAKQQEVNALRDQLQAKRTAFRLQNQQICPQGGMGMGRGAGRGMAMGPGDRCKLMRAKVATPFFFPLPHLLPTGGVGRRLKG